MRGNWMIFSFWFRERSMTRKWRLADWIPWRRTGSRSLPTTASPTRCHLTSTNSSTLPLRPKLRFHRAFPTCGSSTWDRRNWRFDGTLPTILTRTLKCTKSATLWKDSKTTPAACWSIGRNRLSAACDNRLSTGSRCALKPPTDGANSVRPSSRPPELFWPLMNTPKRISKSELLPALSSLVSSSSLSSLSSLFSTCAGKN